MNDCLHLSPSLKFYSAPASILHVVYIYDSYLKTINIKHNIACFSECNACMHAVSIIFLYNNKSQRKEVGIIYIIVNLILLFNTYYIPH